MVRIAYDAIDAASLPKGGDLYLGYVDGNWPSYAAIKKRFPGSLVVGIATNPNTNDGIIGDGPPDNGTWSEWIGWVKRRRAAGEDPWINTNENNNWQPGIEAFRAANVAEPHWWVANYDGSPVLPAGALMKQYASNAGYDTSSCASFLPGIDSRPPVTPPPPPTVNPEDEDMQQIEPLSVHNGEYAYPVENKSRFRFAADGYGAKAELRVAVWAGPGVSVQPTVEVGGGYVDVTLDPAHTSAVTVRRLDNGDFPVGVSAF